MKNLITLTILLCCAVISNGQTDGLSYQAIIIDQNPQEIPGADISGNYLSDTEITLRFTILDSNQDIEFKESQMTSTDAFGMVNLVIGQGFTEPDSNGEFIEINWDGTPKWLVVELAYGGSDFEELSSQNLLFVPYAYHRNIIATETLDVDGASTLNSTLDVGDNTTIEGTLDVADNGSINGTLYVGDDTDIDGNLNVLNSVSIGDDLVVLGNSELGQNLTVGGNTLLNGSMSVLNESPTFLSGTLVTNGATTLNANLTVAGESCLNDQVTIKSTETGGDNSYAAYPLRVEGSEQGIAIKVNASTPNSSNNYVTFFDGNGNAIGRIEGQTADDLTSAPTYIFETATLTASTVTSAAQAALTIAGATVCIGIGPVACPPSWSEIAVAAADVTLAAANLVAYEIFAFEYLGVTYLSASADYAEFLEKENHLDYFSPGDVVGITGGKISHDLTNASQILVISTKPAVLGNQPDAALEINYEKVAFMGQVPVKVIGEVNIGDFVIPSGNNDGIAKGISPDKITPSQYSEIIGIAWSSAENIGMIQTINLSIGLNSNDLADLVASQQLQIDDLESKYTELERRLMALESGEEYVPSMSHEDISVMTDLVEREKDIRKGVYDSPDLPQTITREQVIETIGLMKDLFIESEIDIESNYVLNKLFNDPEFQERVIQETMQNFAYAKNSGLLN